MINLQETERIKQAIEANPQDFAKIIEQTNLGVCITNAEGKFDYVNDNYCRMYGYTREELIGKSFLIVVPPESQQELSELHDKFIKLQVELQRTWEVVRKNGEIMKIYVDAGYTEKIDGKPHKLTFVFPADEKYR
ncbi:MAG: PAS domain S-box protein [Microscillaceae bacterium]|nr:PAS domain S-box protein [Microscillaceae bacterium]MDW8460952.1 PAS domain S-box protein [Cytophagales bacterium]